MWSISFEGMNQGRKAMLGGRILPAVRRYEIEISSIGLWCG